MTAAQPVDTQLEELIASCYADPYRYVMLAFPWGEPGTALEGFDGPDTWQREQLQRIGQAFRDDPYTNIQEAIASGHGIGKAQAYDDIVPTPTGLRRWGDLQPGDQVFGADGCPAVIRQTHHYRQMPMYRVRFDDGSHVDVSSGHLWNVRGRRERRNGLSCWRTMETIEILRAGVKRSNGRSQARQWEIPTQGPAQFAHRDTPLDPYFVGVWLGDGHTGSPRYTKPVPEIAERITACGYRLTESVDGMTYYATGITSHMSDPVFSLNSHERYVPDLYKVNSVDVRRAILSGLIDTDGEVHGSGSIGYCSTSRRLVEDVVWLARSLGYKAMIQPTPKQGRVDGVDKRVAYRATINAADNLFTHPAKRLKHKPSEARYTTRWIDSIEPLPPTDGMCITVDAVDGLYQARDFVVTHNSAETSWIILWAMSTRPHLAGWVTANTQSQLKSKTWRELAVWHKRAINAHWFKWTATRFFQVDHPETWGLDAIPWSEHNSEAFAGLHAEHVLMLMDEASAIADVIWEVAEGAMTTPRAMWLCYGNPTRNTGRFRECFGRLAHRWTTRKIDSRTCKMANRAKLEEWLVDHGEDSDFYRVRVRGEFPRAGSNQLISSEHVHNGRKYVAADEEYSYQPVLIGVDVARFGMDESVILVRQGNKVLDMKTFRNLDNIQVAARAAEAYRRYSKATLFVDEVGVGSGVVDYLKSLGYPVIGVNAGAAADNSTVYVNKRAEMWGRMRDWIDGTVDLPDDPELAEQLTALEYDYTPKEQIRLEKKEDLRARGLSSPDRAEALALTFAQKVNMAMTENSFEPDWEV